MSRIGATSDPELARAERNERRACQPEPAPITIPFSDACMLLELLRLAPIYALMGSEFEEAELGTEPDFKRHKWTGFEKEHADECLSAYRMLLSGMQEQVDKRRSEAERLARVIEDANPENEVFASWAAAIRRICGVEQGSTKGDRA